MRCSFALTRSQAKRKPVTIAEIENRHQVCSRYRNKPDGAGSLLSMELAFGQRSATSRRRIVMIQVGRVPDLSSRIDRTMPMTDVSPTVSLLLVPLNCAIRHRLASFGSVVSSVCIGGYLYRIALSSYRLFGLSWNLDLCSGLNSTIGMTEMPRKELRRLEWWRRIPPPGNAEFLIAATIRWRPAEAGMRYDRSRSRHC